MQRIHSVLATALLASVPLCCHGPGAKQGAPLSSPGDPAQGEVPIAASSGWNGTLLLDTDGVGVWAVASYPVFEQYGSPEVVALDDKGRCRVLVSYSGKWTPLETIHDSKWLAPTAFADVDARVDGSELYAAGQSGNVFQIAAYPNGILDGRLVATLPGREIHTLVAAELDPTLEGAELLAFTRPGGLFSLRPSRTRAGFDVTHLTDLPGRVRDALVLPGPADEPASVATVSRDGRLAIMQLDAGVPRFGIVHEEPMGMGRLALRPSAPGETLVLYSTCDDGRVLRHEQLPVEGWRTETIYAGPQGPRGLAAGRFATDPAAETLAVFGYNATVQLLSKTNEGWRVEPVFTDIDRGHWLTVAELDGRNGTDELLCSGYSGRVVMLARPPGFALPGVATD